MICFFAPFLFILSLATNNGEIRPESDIDLKLRHNFKNKRDKLSRVYAMFKNVIFVYLIIILMYLDLFYVGKIKIWFRIAFFFL